MSDANVWRPSSQISENTKAVEETFIASSGQETFVISLFEYAIGTGALEVYQNGHRLKGAGVDFIEIDESTFSLATPASVSDEIIAVGKVGLVSIVDLVSLPLAGGTMTGNILMASAQLVDGRDISVDGTTLDGIDSKVGYISVSQAVNLDTMESDIVSNNAKISNATHTGDVTGSGILTIATDAVTSGKILNQAVSLVKMADMTTASFLGRDTASAGSPEVLSAAIARSILNVENAADVTDSTNVSAAGALMKTGGEISGNITMASTETVDGRDLSIDGAALDVLAANIFNIVNYGAVGDNATDNLSSIQDAINAAVSAGSGTIWIPKGIFLINGKLTQYSGVENIHFRGEGKSISVIKQTAAATVGILWFLNADNVHVRDIHFDSNNFNSTTEPTIKFNACERMIIENCTVSNTPYMSIGLDGCREFNVLYNRVHRVATLDTDNYGILIASAAAQSRFGLIHGNYSKNSEIGAHGIDIQISCNHIDGNGFGSGIFTTPAVGTSGRYIIKGNTCEGGVGVDSNGFDVKGMEIGGDNTIIMGNICHNNAGYGIGWFGRRNIISGNICYNNGQTGSAAIYRVGLAALYASATINGSLALVTGNHCHDNSGLGGGGPQKYGYADHSANIEKIIFSGNNFDSNDLGPYSLLGSNHSILHQAANLVDILRGDFKVGTTKFIVDAGTGDITTTGNITMGAGKTIDGRDPSTDGTQLDTNTSKLSGIDSGARDDQTGAEIKSAYEGEANTNAFTDANVTKLSGIEGSADITDVTNVTAAGALMLSGGTMTGVLLIEKSGSDHYRLKQGSDEWAINVDSSGNLRFNRISGTGFLNIIVNVNTSGVYRVAGTQVLSARRTGWASTTGAEIRTNFGDADLAATSQALRALVVDFKAHGSIGA